MAKTRTPKKATPQEQDRVEMLKLEAELEDITQTYLKESNMAKAKTAVKKISDRLVKVNENFTINMYDNGYMIEVGGRNDEDDWKTAKIMVSTVEELLELVKLYECQTLSVSSSTLIKIYNCYLRICDDRAMFDEMYKKHSFFII